MPCAGGGSTGREPVDVDAGDDLNPAPVLLPRGGWRRARSVVGRKNPSASEKQRSTVRGCPPPCGTAWPEDPSPDRRDQAKPWSRRRRAGAGGEPGAGSASMYDPRLQRTTSTSRYPHPHQAGSPGCPVARRGSRCPACGRPASGASICWSALAVVTTSISKRSCRSSHGRNSPMFAWCPRRTTTRGRVVTAPRPPRPL